jgi:hypothetical protein
MEIINTKFICPKCYTIYHNIVKLTKTSGICANCRRDIKIPYYIPVNQWDKWWSKYRWKT